MNAEAALEEAKPPEVGGSVFVCLLVSFFFFCQYFVSHFRVTDLTPSENVAKDGNW